MNGQRRHEAPDVGDAVIRMLRGLVTRADEGDTEAIEQLQRVAMHADAALQLGVRQAHDTAGYSWTHLGGVMGVTRQAAQQLAARAGGWPLGVGHVLTPGHDKRTCATCRTGE